MKVLNNSEHLKIKLTIIVVQANSNYRLFQKSSAEGAVKGSTAFGGHGESGGFRRGGPGVRGGFSGLNNAAAQNLPPGTCVDQSGVHPTHTEFLLIPHKSVMVC